MGAKSIRLCFAGQRRHGHSPAMSITSADDRTTSYAPVVPTTEFGADFPVFANEDLKVYIDGEERFDFTVTANYSLGISNDAKAVFEAPGVTGAVLITGSRSPRRTTRFNNGGPLPISSQNLALDIVEAENQEARRDIDRSHKAPLGIAGGVFDASDIENAQENAAIAQAAADVASAAEELILSYVPNAFPPTRTELKALATALTTAAYLRESGREGQWLWRTGDYSALIAADTSEALYVKANAVAATAGAWVRQRHNLELNVMWFGAKGDFDGTTGTDNKVAFQAAWDLAKIVGAGRIIIPPGRWKIGSTGLNLSQSASTTTVTQNIAIVGSGSLGTIIEYTPSASGGICFDVTGGFRIQGLTLRGRGIGANNGIGLVWRQSPWSEVEDVRVTGFTQGLDFRDVFCLNMKNVKSFANLRGMNAGREDVSFGSDPNAFTLTQCTFQNNTHYGISLTKPVTFTMIGGSVEGNGKDTSFTARFGIYAANAGAEGAVGVALFGVYFEGNVGKADVHIDHVLYGCNYVISGCTFNRISATEYVTNNVLVDKGAATLVLTMQGNSFTSNGVYVPSAARRAIQVNKVSGENLKVVGEGTNYYAADAERPTLPCISGGSDGMFEAYGTVNAAGVLSAGAFNIASVVKTGTGTYVYTLSGTARNAQLNVSGTPVDNNAIIRVTGRTSSTITVLTVVSGAATDVAHDIQIRGPTIV